MQCLFLLSLAFVWKSTILSLFWFWRNKVFTKLDIFFVFWTKRQTIIKFSGANTTNGFHFWGFLALPFLPDVPNRLEDSLHKIRNGPLGFIPKPGYGKTKDVILSNPPYYTTAKPVVYRSFIFRSYIAFCQNVKNSDILIYITPIGA